jgi:ATP-binding cassette subfamily C protein LapB
VFEFIMKQTRASMVDRAFKAIDTELSDVFFRKALSIRMDARPHTVGTFASQIRQLRSYGQQ